MPAIRATPERSRSEISVQQLVSDCLRRGDSPAEIWAALEALAALSAVDQDTVRAEFSTECRRHGIQPPHH